MGLTEMGSADSVTKRGGARQRALAKARAELYLRPSQGESLADANAERLAEIKRGVRQRALAKANARRLAEMAGAGLVADGEDVVADCCSPTNTWASRYRTLSAAAGSGPPQVSERELPSCTVITCDDNTSREPF